MYQSLAPLTNLQYLTVSGTVSGGWGGGGEWVWEGKEINWKLEIAYFKNGKKGLGLLMIDFYH